MTTHLRQSTLILLGALVIAVPGVSITAKGGGGDGSDLRIRIPDETGPPGGMVQMKLMTTEVSPISGGRPMFLYNASVFDRIVGFSLFNPDGEAAGAATVDGDRIQVSYITTAPNVGEYPVMAVTIPIRADAVPGTETEFTIDSGSTWFLSTSARPSTARISPGTVTVGGTVSIMDVFPGEGLVPAGTVVSVRGIGFSKSTRLKVDAPIRNAVQFVSENELRFTLTAPTNMTGLEIRATNPDSSRSIYLSYLRGITRTVSARTLLAATRPIFGVTSRPAATFGPLPAAAGGQYAAVALQNPNPDAVAVTLSLVAADGTVLHQSVHTIDSRERRALEVSEWLDGVAPPAGASIVVSAAAPIDAISLLCDEGLWTVAAGLPSEARR
jgi:hypothetical protein